MLAAAGRFTCVGGCDLVPQLARSHYAAEGFPDGNKDGMPFRHDATATVTTARPFRPNEVCPAALG
jgi:hypothetical protein